MNIATVKRLAMHTPVWPALQGNIHFSRNIVKGIIFCMASLRISVLGGIELFKYSSRPACPYLGQLINVYLTFHWLLHGSSSCSSLYGGENVVKASLDAGVISPMP